MMKSLYHSFLFTRNLITVNWTFQTNISKYVAICVVTKMQNTKMLVAIQCRSFNGVKTAFTNIFSHSYDHSGSLQVNGGGVSNWGSSIS